MHSPALLISALMLSLLYGCQTQHRQTQPVSPMHTFNAAAEIAQPADMALRTVQSWLTQRFPDTAQPVQAFNQHTGEVRAQVQFDFPCADTPDCQLRQGSKINATLRIRILPQRVAINFSNLSWQSATGQPVAISQPADQQQVQAQLRSIASSLFSQLAIP